MWINIFLRDPNFIRHRSVQHDEFVFFLLFLMKSRSYFFFQ